MPSENTRRIAKNTAMLYIRMLLIMAVTLYTSRVVLNVLGVEDFGIYNVVGGIVVMFSFLNGAMAQSTQRFLAFELGRGDFQQLQKVFSLSVSIHIGIAFIIFLLAEVLGLWFLNMHMNIPTDRMMAARWIYQFSVFSFVISVIQVPYNALIIAHEQMKVYAYISIVEVLLKLAIVFVLMGIDIDKLKLYAILVFCVTVIVAAIYRVYCLKNYTESAYRFVWDGRLCRQLVSFAGWGFLGGFAAILKNQGLNILLNIFGGAVVNAAYGIALQVNTAVNSFNQNFMTAMNPQIIKSYASNEKKYMISLLLRGAKFSYFLIFLISLPILLETEYLLKFWLKTIPDYTVIFTRLIIIDSLLGAFAFVMGTSAQASGKIKWYQIWVSIAFILNLPVSYYFLRLGYSPQITLVVSIFMTVFAISARLIILHRIIGLALGEFVSKVLWVVLKVSGIALVLPLLVKALINGGLAGCISVVLCSWGSVFLSIWSIGLTGREKEYFKEIFREKVLPLLKK